MAEPKLTLQDVARIAADKNGGGAGRALERAAKRRGLTLSYATVDRILAGKYESTPKRQTIEALAQLAGLDLDVVYEAADLPLPMTSFAEQLPDGSDHLTVDQRRVVLDVIRGFARDNDRMAALEYDRDIRPLHPDTLLQELADAEIDDLDDAALDRLHTYLALALPDEQTVRIFADAFEKASIELDARRHRRGRLADPAGRDGVTPTCQGSMPDLAREDFDLAAKQGRNRGAELREMQDRAAEDG